MSINNPVLFTEKEGGRATEKEIRTSNTSAGIESLKPRIWNESQSHFRVPFRYFNCRVIDHITFFAIVDFIAFFPSSDGVRNVLKNEIGKNKKTLWYLLAKISASLTAFSVMAMFLSLGVSNFAFSAGSTLFAVADVANRAKAGLCKVE